MKNKIESGSTFLGIELGSTRIKAVLIDDDFNCIADGSYEWENKYENGCWTYSLEDIHKGIKGCFASLSQNVTERYGTELTYVKAMGVSGMMHGYLAFDKDDNLLTPFRTWRNTITEEAADELCEMFEFNIPQRWTVAHLYRDILDGKEYIGKISYVTTLAGYIHYILTGRREVGIGEASGIFPVKNDTYDEVFAEKFNNAAQKRGFNQKIEDLFPKVRKAGDTGAVLTADGAAFLDESGKLKSGIPLCPPEGDAGTGMIATNSVLPKTGNVSAGTSVFAMVVLEEQLKKLHREIDMVTTPDGLPVAMVHCNNCCGELDMWVKMFCEFAELAGIPADKSMVYNVLYKNTLNAEADCGKMLAFNYLSGEHLTGVEQGRPMYLRSADGNANLANFMQAQLYSALATLTLGMKILTEDEGVKLERIYAHGGLFKVEGVAQKILANAFEAEVSVMKTAGEGGAWGMALLAAYMTENKGLSLGKWLSDKVFVGMESSSAKPNKEGTAGFEEYLKRYTRALEAEKKLAQVFDD